MNAIQNNKGFTFVEIIIALGLTVIVFGAMIGCFISMKSLNGVSRYYAQATEVVRGQIETLKGTAFDSIANSVSTVSYDAGNDGVFGTADDRKGTLRVTVGDFLDMDGDGNIAETALDVDGDGANDAGSAIPARVTFTWTQWVLGQTKTYTVSADTLISA